MSIYVFIGDEVYEALQPLEEGKSLSTYKIEDEIRQAVIDGSFDKDPGKFKRIRRGQAVQASKLYSSLIYSLESGMKTATQRYLNQRDSKTTWMRKMKTLMRHAYNRAFELGLMSSGAKHSKISVSDNDKKWIESAFRHEMRYLNELTRQISSSMTPDGPIFRKREQGKIFLKNVHGDLNQRIRAYSDSLRHVFYAGKIMGTPSGMIIDWISVLDRYTCDGCRYLASKSPYTKETLPTTPRAGATPCLNRCRCALVVKEVDRSTYHKVKSRVSSKSFFERKLQDIKNSRGGQR